MNLSRAKAPLGSFAITLLLMLLSVAVAAQSEHPGHHSPTSVSKMLCDLQASDAQTRRDAAEALSVLRPVPPETIPGLIQALNDPDQAVRDYVIKALANSGPQAIPAVAHLLKDPQFSENVLFAQNALLLWVRWPVGNLLSGPF
jgi:HEAT repeat protein